MEKSAKEIGIFLVVFVVVMVCIWILSLANFYINQESIEASEELPMPFEILMSIYEFQPMGLAIMIIGGFIIAVLMRL